MSSDIKKYFPYKEVRDQQQQAIEFALSEISNGKKFIVIEAGTGVGKSAIGLTIARYLYNSMPSEKDPGSYFLTTQKILQEQYVKDFGGFLGPYEVH